MKRTRFVLITSELDSQSINHLNAPCPSHSLSRSQHSRLSHRACIISASFSEVGRARRARASWTGHSGIAPIPECCVPWACRACSRWARVWTTAMAKVLIIRLGSRASRVLASHDHGPTRATQRVRGHWSNFERRSRDG